MKPGIRLSCSPPGCAGPFLTRSVRRPRTCRVPGLGTSVAGCKATTESLLVMVNMHIHIYICIYIYIYIYICIYIYLYLYMYMIDITTLFAYLFEICVIFNRQILKNR